MNAKMWLAVMRILTMERKPTMRKLNLRRNETRWLGSHAH